MMFIIALFGCFDQPAGVEPAPYFETGDFWTERDGRSTELIMHIPSPQEYVNEQPPDGVRRVNFEGATETLFAWYRPPPPNGPWQREGRGPVLVVFHSAMAFGGSDFLDLLPVAAAGFGILAPVLRAENGNPGHMEMFYGELDDAIAAVDWVAAQPEVDPARITTFGHSAGGVLSALISLVPGLPIRETTSICGLYDEQAFLTWKTTFDASNPREWRLRAFPHWAKSSMKRPHHAWVGTEDPSIRVARGLVDIGQPLLTLEPVPGTHNGSYTATIPRLVDRLVATERAAMPHE